MIHKLFRAGLLLGTLGLFACSDGGDNHSSGATIVPPPPAPDYLAISNPDVSLPPNVGAPLNFGIVDLEALGYEEQEYFIAGTAASFTNLNELGSDGFWDVEPAEEAQYATRVLVRRPQSAADFNGTVIVEWMNVSSGFDVAPDWDNAHVEIIRSGYAWVGVSAQFVGVEGREGGIAPFHLKGISPARYGALFHPGDSFSFDIFSQAGQAVRNPGAIDLLDGLKPEVLLAVGESQSAFRLVTYVNAIHPLYNPYDGYLIHSRGGYATPLAQAPQAGIATPAEVLIRTDLNAPVLVFQTETDVVGTNLGSARARQDDTDLLRIWEVAGTAHGDRYSLGAGWTDAGDDASAAAVEEIDNVQGFIQCDRPFNSGPMHYVVNASLDALNRWVTKGTLPAMGEPLQVNDDLSGFLIDDNGNALGGIRTPYVDVPVATLSGLGQTGGSFCGLFGTTVLFDATTLVNLYGDEASYVSRVEDSANAAVAAGFLLPADARQIIKWAPHQWRIQLAGSAPVVPKPVDGPLFNFRYCEVLLADVMAGQIEAAVYNSMGLNMCPQEDWDALDAAAIASEFGATTAILNGPRFWVLDSIVQNGEPPLAIPESGRPELAIFGNIDMRLVATVVVAGGAAEERAYKENVVTRDTVFKFVAGRRVYELIDPEGQRYMMQSFSRIVDDNLELSELAILGSRLQLPPGWLFETRELIEPYDLVTEDGEAVVITDDLSNTYQRVPTL